MSANGMSILESMVLSPETLRKREFIMAIASDLLAGGDPSEPDSTIPDIGFDEPGDEIVMIDAPEDEPSEPAPAPTNDRAAPDAPAPRPEDTGAAAPAPKAETASSTIETIAASVAAPVASTPDAAPRTPERKAEEARELNAPLETRAAATNLIQLVMNNATAGVIGNVRPMGGAAERMVTAARDEQSKKDEEFMRSFARRELQARIDRLTAELAAIDAQIAKNEERSEELRKAIEARETLRRLKAEGKFDPANPAHRALLDAAGYDAGDVQRDDFDARAKRDNDRDADDRRRVNDATDGLKRDRGEIQGDLNDARRDYDARYGRGEKLPTEELRVEAATTHGAEQVAAAATTSQRREVKEALAEAVVANVDADSRGAASEFGHDVATDVAAVTNTGTADFDFDTPPVQTASADTKATDIFPSAPAVGAAFAEASGGTSSVQTASLTEDAQSQPAQTRATNPAMMG